MPFAILAVLVIVGIIFLVYYFSADQRVKRELKSTPRYAIAQLPEDVRGRIVGVATPLEAPLAAPLTGRPCVYFIATVEEYRRHGKSGSWRKLASETRGVPFVLEDDTGRALVDPRWAQAALDFDNRSTSGTFDNPTPTEQAFLERNGLTGQGWVFNKKLRYREATIASGERIAILGSGTREPDPDRGPNAQGGLYRDGGPTRLRIAGTEAAKLLISDDVDTLA